MFLRMIQPRIFLTATMLALGLVLCSCQLLTPEDPPLEIKELYPDDFAWDRIEIERTAFEQQSRLNCSKIESELTSFGRCKPLKLSFGSTIECQLPYPFQRLIYGCLDVAEREAPAVYTRLVWNKSAKNIDFTQESWTCSLAEDGPIAGNPARYPTDPGYRVCLLESTGTPGTLRGKEGELRPAGLYLDLAALELPREELEKMIQARMFSGPLEFVMDTRSLPQDERKKALDDVLTIFNFYRKQEIAPQMN